MTWRAFQGIFQGWGSRGKPFKEREKESSHSFSGARGEGLARIFLGGAPEALEGLSWVMDLSGDGRPRKSQRGGGRAQTIFIAPEAKSFHPKHPKIPTPQELNCNKQRARAAKQNDTYAIKNPTHMTVIFASKSVHGLQPGRLNFISTRSSLETASATRSRCQFLEGEVSSCFQRISRSSLSSR